MVDITHKITTLRTAVAQAIVKVSSNETIQAVLNNKVPKGNVLEVARTAGLFAVKNTSSVIPDCHPIPIEYTGIKFDCQEYCIKIEVTVKTIYRTGVEVEAMHGASVAALTVFDMLKPIDKNVEILTVKLVHKKGGKSDYKVAQFQKLNIAIMVCSDSVSARTKEDQSGKIITQKLEKLGLFIAHYDIIPDDITVIQKLISDHCTSKIDLIIMTGGTGLSHRDVTPEAILPLIDRRIHGIEEAIRSYGQERTPFAMLSRSVVGFKGNTLLMALPGSTSGAAESIDAVFPSVLHLFQLINGFDHAK
ncbi:bifunctional molybdenum cofactor biosynthesis protein MoaC/MoaB [Flavobacterium sp.]|uniref:bifunctional molybdenum cofactor biosynthesis protein MoaC/MoaB n=1 Tax=Flavobacterium sp. TaxID=239 RepID=UPI0025D1DC8A|nr:bifunctional molybdenum cofactor biosynthesis protein MoaC/MoaB [Flavobacterium sp.]